jgi:hypothetical protein
MIGVNIWSCRSFGWEEMLDQPLPIAADPNAGVQWHPEQMDSLYGFFGL